MKFHLILVRMNNVSDKSCRENQNTHLCLVNIFLKIVPFMRHVEKYGIARQATDDNIKWHMHFACWISKATDTNSECGILTAY